MRITFEGMMLAFTLPLLACSSEVRLDDGEGGGTSGDGGRTGVVATSTTNGSVASATASGGFDVTAACVSACDTVCVGGPMTCLEACTEAWTKEKAWCSKEWTAAFACGLRNCMPGNDCTAEDDALLGCTIIDCPDYACTETSSGCSCKGTQCEEGHTRRSECRPSPTGSTLTCDCYENEALVYACETSVGFCRPDFDCCDQYLRNGGA